MRSQNGCRLLIAAGIYQYLSPKLHFKCGKFPAPNLSFLYQMNRREFGGPNSSGLPSSVARWYPGSEQLPQDVLSYLNGMPDNGSGILTNIRGLDPPDESPCPLFYLGPRAILRMTACRIQ